MHSLQIAELMRQLEVDIAIDLAGYTTDSRTQIFLHRPAPIQVNYLGYPGTMGLDCYDYILADRTVIPEEQQAFYREKPAYLDHCYLPIASGLEVAKPLPRAAYGLPNKGFVFCAFSHDYKIHPDLFAIWMRLLKSKPGSVLWLVSRNEVSQQNLRQGAETEGVEPDRLIFASRVPKVEDHLARYLVADLFLDTWPYNAHTTAADALLAGLPVITYEGSSFPSRVASSLLKTLGLEQLVTHSLEEYFQLADNLAHKPKRLKALKSQLSPEALEGHPFLGQSFTRSLERVLDGLEASSVTASPAPRGTTATVLSRPIKPARSGPPKGGASDGNRSTKHAKELVAKAEAFFHLYMQERPWVGVHFHGPDKDRESSGLAQIEASYFAFIDRIVELNPTIGIFLLADSSPLKNQFLHRYGDRLLGAQSVRTGTGGKRNLSKADLAALHGEPSLRNLLALKCDYFIGHRDSSLSRTIANLRDWPQGRMFLLGEKGHRSEEDLQRHQEKPETTFPTAPRPAGPGLPNTHLRKLHIGGKTRTEGWEILNANPDPCVDHVCNANNLAQFDDNTFQVIYASHVVEHFDYTGELQNTLKEWHRVLMPGGSLYISVPDLEILAGLLLEKQQFGPNERFAVMRMMFGGHTDKYDYHFIGLNEEFLASFLATAGFVNTRRVSQFGLFNDTSNLIFNGIPISLNVITEKI
jgi:predicted SAM-dependent methyltransferase